MFKFDGNYKNLEQVAQFYPEFMAVHQELEAQGKYPYNDSFLGKIAGLAGEDEGKGIYLLQNLKTEKVRQAKIDELLADGYEQVKPEDGGMRKFENVIKIGTNTSRAGTMEFPKGKIWFAEKQMFIVPKGNRTRGYNVWPDSVVLVKS